MTGIKIPANPIYMLYMRLTIGTTRRGKFLAPCSAQIVVVVKGGGGGEGRDHRLEVDRLG